ncbi:MAG TPA: response regulator [Candidatus Paceibacterota bacterium]|nr:response regulator [Verrucomicrobiota bacterium]HRY46844.1 response regulator [Candidatus Paceibacterota bacterium]HSA00829.1 response regulator [Candidatus Paceibacterota bacterium]
MGVKILTVDDSKTIRLIVARAFKTFDTEILEASNGVEGLAVASREKPDIILLDFTMPVMDGMEMLGKLKSNTDLKSIPVVMLTAEAGRENVTKIAKMGVRDYIVKPFKEELVVERVGRIVELMPRGATVAKIRRYDDPLNLLLVDDKPAILEQLRTGLADTPWTITSAEQVNLSLIERITQNPPDLILASLSLPSDAACTLFQKIRNTIKTQSLPIFGLSVKTETDEQVRAQQLGFTGIVTKPIDFNDLKAKITRALNLDTTYKYFERQANVLVIKVPTVCTSVATNEIAANLRLQAKEAVDAGIDKLVMDISRPKSVDVTMIELGLRVVRLCQELSLKYIFVGSEPICRECINFAETKDWRFANSIEEAVGQLGGGTRVSPPKEPVAG